MSKQYTNEPAGVDWQAVAMTALHDLTIYNMGRKRHSQYATCLCCKRTVKLKNRYPFDTTDSRRTAICPCLADAILFTKDPVKKEVVDALHKKYFSRDVSAKDMSAKDIKTTQKRIKEIINEA